METDSKGNGKSKMKLTIANRLYSWDPINWLHIWASKNYQNLQSKTLDRTMHWHDVLSDFIDEIPENIPVAQYSQVQELRRDIGHYRIDLMQNKMEKIGYDFEK